MALWCPCRVLDQQFGVTLCLFWKYLRILSNHSEAAGAGSGWGRQSDCSFTYRNMLWSCVHCWPDHYMYSTTNNILATHMQQMTFWSTYSLTISILNPKHPRQICIWLNQLYILQINSMSSILYTTSRHNCAYCVLDTLDTLTYI